MNETIIKLSNCCQLLRFFPISLLMSDCSSGEPVGLWILFYKTDALTCVGGLFTTDTDVYLKQALSHYLCLPGLNVRTSDYAIQNNSLEQGRQRLVQIRSEPDLVQI